MKVYDCDNEEQFKKLTTLTKKVDYIKLNLIQSFSPETIDEALGADNKLLGWWSKFSWDNGLSQQEFLDGIEVFRNEYYGEQTSAEDEGGG